MEEQYMESYLKTLADVSTALKVSLIILIVFLIFKPLPSFWLKIISAVIAFFSMLAVFNPNTTGFGHLIIGYLRLHKQFVQLKVLLALDILVTLGFFVVIFFRNIVYIPAFIWAALSFFIYLLVPVFTEFQEGLKGNK